MILLIDSTLVHENDNITLRGTSQPHTIRLSYHGIPTYTRNSNTKGDNFPTRIRLTFALILQIAFSAMSRNTSSTLFIAFLKMNSVLHVEWLTRTITQSHGMINSPLRSWCSTSSSAIRAARTPSTHSIALRPSNS